MTTSTTTGPRRAFPLWLVVVAGSLITTISLGVRSTFGLFLDPVIDSLGTGRGAFALAIAIQNLVWGISQPFAGAVADRFGSAKVLSIGAVIYAFGLILMSSADSSGILYLSAGFVVGLGTGAASFAVVLAAVGRMAPPEKRSLALGIVTAMGSVGQFVLVPTVQRLIDSWGWEDTALAMAGVILLVILGAPGLRGRSIDQAPAGNAHAVPLGRELRRAAYSKSFRLLNLAFFVCGFHVTFIGTHLASYAEDVGQTRRVAATALALVGLFNIMGSLGAGVLGGRFPKSRLLSIIYASRAIVIAAFVVIPSTTTTTVVFGAAMGVLWLSTVPLTSAIVAQQFGTAHAGTLFGLVFLAHQIGAFLGAWMGGTLADRAGSYDPVWWIAVALGVMAATLHLFIDEGPQPEPPPAVRAVPSPVGGVAALILAVGITAGLSLGSPRPAEAQPPGLPPAAYCVLHPV
ncbi:MAG: MFS transporter [Actinomycetia bacterium]|nr:MFS transporter [Actinomycetes bacterium]